MDKIRFAHLSDTHISADIFKPDMENTFHNPNTALKEVLYELKRVPLDFMIISGDLTHDGKLEDYTCLKEILAESELDIPIFMAMGNHDRKDQFRNVFLKENSLERLYYATEIKGLRVIVLDSAEHGLGHGFIDQRQLDWLEKTLSIPSEKGSICILHHPVFWENPSVALEHSDRLIHILHHPDIKCVFCGHTHISRLDFSQGIFQSIAESLAYGYDDEKKTSIVSGRRGYHLCLMNDREVSVFLKVSQTKASEAARILRNM